MQGMDGSIAADGAAIVLQGTVVELAFIQDLHDCVEPRVVGDNENIAWSCAFFVSRDLPAGIRAMNYCPAAALTGMQVLRKRCTPHRCAQGPAPFPASFINLSTELTDEHPENLRTHDIAAVRIARFCPGSQRRG
jgi:hypothetical protein